jgi:hypothetical protein
MNIGIKFPEGMSQRDKEVILEMIREEMKRNPPKDEEEATMRIRAFLGEHLPYNTREFDPK